MNTKPRVKICCIRDIEEAQMAIRHGASAVGLVSKMPSGPGVIEEEVIVEIAASVPPGVATFLLTSRQDAPSIIAQQRRTGVNTIQLVDSVSVETYEELRRSLPGVGIVQVIHILGNELIQEAKTVAPFVNAVLLDSGNPMLAIKELGGTGRTHDWNISHRIREEVNVPVFLAGGLKPENVADAIKQVRPYGLDACSGVRTNGKLDEGKLEKFFLQVATTSV